MDSLDAFILAAIQELEELRGQEIPAADLEGELVRIWQRSYAHATAHEEERLRGIWLTRGRAIKQQYPDAAVRRQIYRTSLSPRSAVQLVAGIDAIRRRLIEGANYAALTTDARLAYIGDVLELMSQVASFRISRELGRRRNFDDWRQVLGWWLAKNTWCAQPDPAQITAWYEFASHNFIYRGAWGSGVS